MIRNNQLLAPTLGALSVLAVALCMFVLSVISANSQAMMLPVDPDPLVVVTDSGEKHFRIEIADDQPKRSMGLMFRKDMADDHGMLFIFEQTQPAGFWMKNTPMPLDLIFIDKHGKIRDILQGEPFSEAVIASAEPVRFVLELKAGTAAKSGIKNGDIMRHRVIGAASGAGNPG